MNIRDLVVVYLRTIEGHDLDAVAALLHDDVVVRDGKIWRQEQYDCFNAA
ncbi:MAG: hypothetical protein JNL83_03455 [Myxococcales bacterium]|nr:hypothetical protein [Myxococcales bacterium]